MEADDCRCLHRVRGESVKFAGQTDQQHVRDAMTVEDSISAGDLMRPVLRLEASTPVHAALATMREARNHLAVVDGDAGPGVVTLTDVLQRLPQNGGRLAK